MKTRSQLDQIIATESRHATQAIENAQKFRAKIPGLVELFHNLPSLRFCYFYPNDARIICGIETRDDLAIIRALYKGVWQKNDATRYEATSENLEYTASIDGIEINVRITELPPSCVAVEETREIPAHTVTIRRLVCSEPTKEHALQGEILSEAPSELVEF